MMRYFYPNFVKRFYILSAPKLFTFFWNIVRQLLGERTRKLIKFIYRKNMEKHLSEHIEIRNLPEFLGGQNKAKLNEYPGCWREFLDKNEGIMNKRLSENVPGLKYLLTE